MEVNVSAQNAYNAYGSWLGWKDASGQMIPAWSQLSTQVKNAWTAAIQTVTGNLSDKNA